LVEAALKAADEREPDGPRARRLRYGRDLDSEIERLTELLDGGSDGPHVASLKHQREKIDHPDLTPSAQMLAEMRERSEGFFALAWRWSETHRQAFQEAGLDPEQNALFERLAAESIARRQEIEAADRVDFETFLNDYFAGRPSFQSPMS